MLSWAGVLPTRGLIRRTRAWCPLCYDEQRRQNRIVYDPLLWGLEAVSVCLVHHSPLSTCCPNPACGKAQSFLAPLVQAGHCARCGCWLGLPPTSARTTGPEAERDDLSWHIWSVQVVGDLLAAAPILALEPAREHLASEMSAFVSRFGGGLTAAARRFASRSGASGASAMVNRCPNWEALTLVTSWARRPSRFHWHTISNRAVIGGSVRHSGSLQCQAHVSGCLTRMQ